jgi:CRISPR-associated exonuclease Cas4
MYSEDDLQPLSALQHLFFCERQWGLIHIEGAWAENRLTVEGKHLHERVHEADSDNRGNVRTVRGLRLHSLRLGLVGQADAVEFRADSGGVAIEGAPGRWRPVPIEYKRGRPKRDRCDEVQLCAQALCLEEMLGAAVAEGALFYFQTRRRLDVVFDESLRAETEALAGRLHDLVRAGKTPPPNPRAACDNCSLQEQCMPKATGGSRSARTYLDRNWSTAALDEGEGPP